MHKKEWGDLKIDGCKSYWMAMSQFGSQNDVTDSTDAILWKLTGSCHFHKSQLHN
jgi:hypothetical protein